MGAGLVPDAAWHCAVLSKIVKQDARRSAQDLGIEAGGRLAPSQHGEQVFGREPGHALPGGHRGRADVGRDHDVFAVRKPSARRGSNS